MYIYVVLNVKYLSIVKSEHFAKDLLQFPLVSFQFGMQNLRYSLFICNNRFIK